MIDHDTLRLPPDDPPDSGAMLTFDELGAAQDIFGLDIWSDLAHDPSSLSALPVPLVHNDNPNSSLGCHLDLNDPLAGALDVPHDTTSTLSIWATPFDTQLWCLDKPLPGVGPVVLFLSITDAASLGCCKRRAELSAVGGTALSGADGAICPRLLLAPDPPTAASPHLAEPGSIFQAGPVPPIDDWGGSYSVADSVDPQTPQQLPDQCGAMWAYLALPENPPYSPGPHDLLGSVAPATSPGAGILDSGFDQVACVPEVQPQPPPPDSPPGPSPASSDSSGSESSSGDDIWFGYPLFPGRNLASVPPVPAAPDPPSATLGEEVSTQKTEIDAYVDALARMRQQRGSGPSLVKLKCPWCKKTDRRPSELKEHMYAHCCLTQYTTSGPGAALTINAFGGALPPPGFRTHRTGTTDLPDPGILDDVGHDPNSSLISSAQPVHNDNPNSSLECYLDLSDLLAHIDSLPTGALAASALPTWPPPPDNQLFCLDQQSSEVVTTAVRGGSDRYFNVAGNTYRCGADGNVRLHQWTALDSFPTVPPYPVQPGSIFSIGLLPFFVDNSGRLYSVVDRADPLEPKQVFDNDDAAWDDLGFGAGYTHLPDFSRLPDSCSPATSLDDSILNFDFGQAPVHVPDVSSPGSPPALSPASSDSNASDSSFGSNARYEPPSLFGGNWPQSAAQKPANSNPPPPPTLSLDEGALKIVAEIDAYVDSLVVKRKRRGTGSSLVKLECPRCDKFKSNRRPTELKEHMYAHYGLAREYMKEIKFDDTDFWGLVVFPCPRPGCTHVSNRKSNRKRHLNQCRAGRASDDGLSPEPQVS
ncbi:hypothetical protein FRC06_003825 [Ceratobasidium sp. 370]|nr:hypothetical protein FRC06_003825 [Ceratobasidium sp. 370]